MTTEDYVGYNLPERHPERDAGRDFWARLHEPDPEVMRAIDEVQRAMEVDAPVRSGALKT